MDYTAVGDTTNLAARVQQSAKAGEVWLSASTWALVRDYFSEEGVGEVTLKGKTERQKLYRLLSERADVRTRFDAGLVRAQEAGRCALIHCGGRRRRFGLEVSSSSSIQTMH